MKQFPFFISEKNIVNYLCGIRARIAFQRNKLQSLHDLNMNKSYNCHLKFVKPNDEFKKTLIAELAMVLPPRRKWISLGRERMIDKIPINTVAKNKKRLYRTYLRDLAKGIRPAYCYEIEKMCKRISQRLVQEDFNFKIPKIFPRLKNPRNKDSEVKQECRPISQFNLEDSIILSQTNRFLTQIFDEFFLDTSFAFRAKKQTEEKKIQVSHHDTIIKIQEYLAKHPNSDIWVAECDMKKFYDTVNHRILIQSFEKFIEKAKTKHPEISLEIPIKVFIKYLECYAFNTNVYPLNTQTDYWANNKINGVFNWVDTAKYYTSTESERIGVPQGGALSGLIANLYLHEVDICLEGIPDLLYMRFCDDMILMHPQKETCELAVKEYSKNLSKLFLFPHDFKIPEDFKCRRKKIGRYSTSVPYIINVNSFFLNTIKPFWDRDTKSKAPYKWDSIENSGYPWIGFVGYEINRDGNIRVRKKSFRKELSKQYELTEKLKKLFTSEVRKPFGTISESLIHRLIGMSVGRMTIYNYSKSVADLCWKNGFRILNKNKFSVRQIKKLDRSRSKLYYGFLKYIKTLSINEPISDIKNIRKTVKYDKPFSYYYQIIERKE